MSKTVAKYQKYAEYKDSGVEWLGDIPSHWYLKPIKYLFDIVNGSTPKSGEEAFWDGEITWITPSDLSKLNSHVIGESIRTITKKGLDSCGTSLVPSDTIILSCRAPIGSLAITSKEACTNQGCKSLVKKYDLSAKFFYYYLSISTKQLNNLGRGTTFLELSSDELGNYALGIPNAEEQTQIANFLDHETAKIDSLIAKQEKLIELLKEKRQAVISHAVTKGLNPDVKMKDSGVDWLGQVPEHWELYKLKHACSEIFLGLTSKVDYVEADGVPLVRALNIKNGILDLSTAKQISVEQHEKLTKYRCAKRNDILLSKSGTIGTAAIVDTDIEFSIYESIFALRGRVEILLPTYLLYFIQSKVAQAQYEKNSVGMGVVHLNMPDIQEVIIPLPTKEEQVQILEHLVMSLEYFNSLIYKAESAIQLMQERRTALISSAVTGKINVTNWQHPNKNNEANTELGT